jgi:hypothetical protein
VIQDAYYRLSRARDMLGSDHRGRAAVCPLSGGTEVLCCVPQGVAEDGVDDS